uniref:Uncharacterized protein n=1 Tax=Opuntia streptacantha TaxID=393608 RepID=A0A7C9B2B0_OPUST
MVVSFSLEPATASLMPSREAIWLSLSHRSSSLVSFSISSIDVSLFDETSKTRRFTKVDKPSILEMPLWLRYNSSSVTHSSNPFVDVKRLLCKLTFLRHFRPHKLTALIRFLPNHNSCKFTKVPRFSIARNLLEPSSRICSP